MVLFTMVKSLPFTPKKLIMKREREREREGKRDQVIIGRMDARVILRLGAPSACLTPGRIIIDQSSMMMHDREMMHERER